MSYKKCCVPKCKTTRSDQIVMHLFPNPDKELERFTTWKNAIGGHIQLLDSNTIFGLRRVCHIHFETKYHTRSKRLSPNAVPTLYVTGRLHHFPSPDNPYSEKFVLWKKVLSELDKAKGDSYIFNNLYLCDNHFEKFYLTNSGRLTKNAVPTLTIDVLHRFPKPESSLERFLEWKKIVGSKLEDKTNDDIYTNCRICNNHFEERFFYPQSKRLAKTSFPTLNLGTHNIVLHTFPDPERETERFNSWVNAAGINTSSLDINFIYKNRRICHDHFAEKYLTWTRRLTHDAIPTLCLPGTVHRFPNYKKFPERFKEWVIICGGTLATASDYEHYKNKIVCDRHFTYQDHNRNHRLNALAVPSLYLSGKPVGSSTQRHTSPTASVATQGALLHRFPNPNNPDKIEQFRTWIMKIGGDIIGEDNNYIYRNRKVCHRHFDEVYIYPNMRLSALAIPTLHIPDVGSSTQKRTSLTTSVAAPDKSIVQESTSQRPIDEPSSPKQTDTSANASVSAPESIEKPNSNEATESPTIYEEQDVTEELETEHVIPVSKTYTRYKRNEPECTKPEESIVPVAKTYTWEKQSEAVSINADDVADMTEYLEDMNEDLTMFCDDEEPPSPQPGVIGNSYQYDKTLHEGYHCDVCKGEIRGFRYTCVQCSDLDLCSACELDRAHHHHYVLRVPEPRPYAEVQSVLARIRAHLMQKLDPITQSEQDNDDAVSIKSEVKSESEDDEDNYETRSQDSSHSSVSSKTQKQKDHDDEDHTTDNIERLDPPDNEEPIDSIDISSDEETQSNAQDEENNTLGMETSPLSSSVRQQPTSKHKVLPSTVRKKIICNLKDFIRMRQTPPSTGKRIRVMPVLKKADVSTRKEITHKFDFKPQKKMMVVKLPPGAVLNDGLRVLVQRLPLSEDTRHNADIDNR